MASKTTHQQRVAAGLCRYCSQPALDGKVRCESCRDKQSRMEKGRKRNGPYKAKVEATANRNLKIKVMTQYGGVCCVCCGESTLEFLQIDHINNGGGAHRRAIKRKAGTAFYRWLRENDFPEGFQVLCANCNFAKGCYGECPHAKARRLAEAQEVSLKS